AHRRTCSLPTRVCWLVASARLRGLLLCAKLLRAAAKRGEGRRTRPAGLRVAAADRGVSNETLTRASSSTARATTFWQRASVRNRPVERGERNGRTLDLEHAAVLAFHRPDRPLVDDRDRAALAVFVPVFVQQPLIFGDANALDQREPLGR